MKKYRQLIIGIIIGAFIFGSASMFAENKTIVAFFNNIKIVVDGNVVKTDIEPLIYSEQVYMPLDAVSKVFGATVKWNKSENAIEITKTSAITTTKSSTTIPTAPPTPTPRIVKSPTQNKEITVYITKTGAKYHRSGCRYLSRSCIPISLKNAKDQGYSPCSVCGPPK